MSPDGYRSFVMRLRARLALPLPGVAAQRIMAPVHRLEDGYDPFPGDARKAAVLLALWPASGNSATAAATHDAGLNGSITVPLIERPRDGSVHSGEIALPGGRRDGIEPYPVATALREAHEELGLETRHLELLGALTPLYIPVSGTVVTPVVAATTTRPELTPSPREVRAVHLGDLTRLAGTRELGRFETAVGSIVAPAFRIDHAVVWGATAMILNELLWVYQDIAGRHAPGAARG